jgi:hypothetical protein
MDPDDIPESPAPRPRKYSISDREVHDLSFDKANKFRDNVQRMRIEHKAKKQEQTKKSEKTIEE